MSLAPGMNFTIYIDGMAHKCTDVSSGTFYADHPSLPNRYCSQHRIGPSAAIMLKAGQGVRTSGHLYSLRPPMAVERKPALAPFVQMKPPTPLPELQPDPYERIHDTLYIVARRMAILAMFIFICLIYFR